MKIAIVGKGNVGNALKSGLERAGHEVKIIGKDPAGVREAASSSEIVILAVPFTAIDATVRELGDSVRGKVVVDATNALTPDYQLALGCSTSGAEELQKKVPNAKVVKAFNTVFAQNMVSGQVKGEQLTLFVAGDDSGAKGQVLVHSARISRTMAPAGM